MLPKTYRGLKASEVSDLFTGVHHSASNPFFRVVWRRTDEMSPRFVVITSGKLHKSAVVRNRLRRMVYDMIGASFSKWTDGGRVAIVVKSSALAVTKQEFKDSFYDLMKKPGLF
jgi:ribonuclease P protein component